VYYTEDAGKKVVHFFEALTLPIFPPAVAHAGRVRAGG
jgi:hypothetical protein